MMFCSTEMSKEYEHSQKSVSNLISNRGTVGQVNTTSSHNTGKPKFDNLMQARVQKMKKYRWWKYRLETASQKSNLTLSRKVEITCNPQ